MEPTATGEQPDRRGWYAAIDNRHLALESCEPLGHRIVEPAPEWAADAVLDDPRRDGFDVVIGQCRISGRQQRLDQPSMAAMRR
ncbi:hypothetical protein [Sphingopyxis panaciterrae]